MQLMLRPTDIDEIVAEIYALAKHDQTTPPGPISLAKRLLGHEAVLRVPYRAISGDGAFALVDGHAQLYLRSGIPPERLSFAAAHELGHWICRQLGYRAPPEVEEADCNAIAGAILIPRRVLRPTVSKIPRLPELAGSFVVTESCAALRIGEATGLPMCLVAPSTVRVRGEAYGWPSQESELRQLAKVRRPGLHKARLRDDPARILIVAGKVTDPAS
jgi:hypothetical protein